MGTEATKGIEARRRRLAAQIERLIEEAEKCEPVGVARRHRIKDAVRRGLREQRGIEAHARAVAAAELRQGRVLLELTQEGLSERASYDALRLSRPVGQRRLRMARFSAGPAELSTASAQRVGRPAPSADRDCVTGEAVGTTQKR